MKCNKCDGSGLISFNDRHDAFVYCQCHDEPEHYHRPDPSDFDFAMSDSFRGYSYERCGIPDPAYRPSEPEEPKEQVIVHRHSNMGAEERDLLQQTSLKVDWLEKKLNELSKKRKLKDRL